MNHFPAHFLKKGPFPVECILITICVITIHYTVFWVFFFYHAGIDFTVLLGTHHLISGGGGGGARQKLKKIVCRHKSQKKKFVENVGRKKSLSLKLMKNKLTRKNTKW